MFKIRILFGVVLLSVFAACSPVFDGKEVGTVIEVGKNIIVSGQRIYPFVASITINADGLTYPEECTGVIIGKTTVLTAAHCLHDKVNPEIYVHVGVVDLELEEETGQKVRVFDYFGHKLFREKCFIGKRKYCIGINDIAILWLEKKLIFGQRTNQANLSFNKKHPVGKVGTILGWGEIKKGVLPMMLHEGQMKVLSGKECRNFNKNAYITENVLCLISVEGKATKAGRGDSGGPFVIDGFVYGISSVTIHKDITLTRSIDSYTFIPNYMEWISYNVRKGPPKLRETKV